jgi:hypothetical protein
MVLTFRSHERANVLSVECGDLDSAAHFTVEIRIGATPQKCVRHIAVGAMNSDTIKARLPGGKPIGNMDLLIASHAVSEGYAVVTNNVKHFSNVPGLKVEVWQ